MVRMFCVLELVAGSGAVGVGECVKALGIASTTIHRIVTTLEAFGYIQKNRIIHLQVHNHHLGLSTNIPVLDIHFEKYQNLEYGH